MNAFLQFLIPASTTFGLLFVGSATINAIAKLLNLYAIVQERQALVLVLFGKVIGVIDSPGLYILPLKFGPLVTLVSFLGKSYTVDLRLDQEYLRSNPVNSEEGAPMGIGIWYERRITEPVDYLFKNSDPVGSLNANVGNSTTRCLSNMPLSEMLENRHTMSQTVREEVAPHAQEWGYSLGSVYIRKVHFKDSGMIKQIEAKVVNRLRQITAGIKQDGANQVSIITSTAEQQAAAEFARAAATRPKIVGEALSKACSDPEITSALFEVLETQRILEGKGTLTLLPNSPEGNTQFLEGIISTEK
jgi:regulator of protease activity HflC (stomatin/prohibitin superfamily)